jgi:hypothetical protein
MNVEAGAAGMGGGAPCGNPVWGTGILPFPSASLAPFLKNLSMEARAVWRGRVGLYGRPPFPSAHSLPEGQQGEKLFRIWQETSRRKNLMRKAETQCLPGIYRLTCEH